MRKIAVIVQESINNRKGAFNAVWNRIYYLKKLGRYDIDVFFIQNYFPWYIRVIKEHKLFFSKPSEVDVNGILFKMYYNPITIFNYLLEVKFCKKSRGRDRMIKKLSDLMSSYDLISAHSTIGGEIALNVYKKFAIPYCVTWHGSDIHTSPWSNHNEYVRVLKIIESAEYNFFVSKDLLQCAEKITTKGKKCVLYNSASNQFYKYSDSKKMELKSFFLGDQFSKVIAYVGNLLPIKNPMILPDIFESVQKKYGKLLYFWIIGDGKMRNELENKFNNIHNLKYKFWGNQSVEDMPKIMNCIDVLVLPSLNEGLPLVTVEALKCGSNVVGSRVGGISEAIGKENVFDLNDSFVDNISTRIVEMLSNHIVQEVPILLDWEKTAELECNYYSEILINKIKNERN